ncbi:MAG: discoidin domain-containing protein [[Clostridium] nexile]
MLSNDKYGNNGHFNEVWMDGAKGSGAGYQEYTFEKWFDTIQQYEGKKAGFESDCMLFGAEAYTTVRWIGNELGYANEETWSKSKVDYEKNTIDSKKVGSYTVGYEDGNQWTVPESDARITSGWFWGTTKNTPKSVEDLAGMYFNSVGHNSPLLLNIPPNNQGKVDDAILKRVTEFGQNINDTFKSNIAAYSTVKASEVRGNDVDYSPENVLDGKDDTYWTVNDGTTTGELVVELGETKTFDVVSIEEAIQFGQRIKAFKVEYSNDGSDWKVFDQGTTIGAKRLSREGAVKADKLRITVTTSKDVPMISEVGVYKATAGFESPSSAPEGMQVIDERDEAFKFSDGWTQENASQYLNGTNAWAKKGASFEMKFTGLRFIL